MCTSVTQAEIDAGHEPGTTSAEAVRIKQLEYESRELRRANAILRSAASFFAAERKRPTDHVVAFIASHRKRDTDGLV